MQEFPWPELPGFKQAEAKGAEKVQSYEISTFIGFLLTVTSVKRQHGLAKGQNYSERKSSKGCKR